MFKLNIEKHQQELIRHIAIGNRKAFSTYFNYLIFPLFAIVSQSYYLLIFTIFSLLDSPFDIFLIKKYFRLYNKKQRLKQLEENLNKLKSQTIEIENAFSFILDEVVFSKYRTNQGYNQSFLIDRDLKEQDLAQYILNIRYLSFLLDHKDLNKLEQYSFKIQEDLIPVILFTRK
jgi:hypothetical protein